MIYSVKNGVYYLNNSLSKLEKQVLDDCGDFLENKGMQYIAVPSLITWDSFNKQGLDKSVLSVDSTHVLAGSAEQGILEKFTDQEVATSLFYSKNQCFRYEDEYNDLLRVKEFTKVEQFCFCTNNNWEWFFEHLLDNAVEFIHKYGITSRVIDVTKRDPGYHIIKYDIEILTKRYGWIESHSCTYFGEEQSKRYNISGATHTISNTGIAVPRFLIPLIENGYQ